MSLCVLVRLYVCMSVVCFCVRECGVFLCVCVSLHVRVFEQNGQEK